MNATACLVSALNVSINRGSVTVLKDLNFCINAREHWAIVGASGTGKTTLLQALAGQVFCRGELTFQSGNRRVLVAQQHRFTNLSHTTDFYYQQRFNSMDAEDAQTVAEAYPELFEQTSGSVDDIAEVFSLGALRDRRLIQLSNGENKRVQLAHAMLQQPNLLLLDNPFLGLDVAAREGLEHLLKNLAQSEITIIVTCSEHRIPPFITHVLELKSDGAAQVHQFKFFKPAHIKVEDNLPEVPPALLAAPAFGFKDAVRMQNVQVQYGQKQVLQNVSWQVRRGERWLLSGPNGAGKSTLLSLITADNPQAYANEVYLFDKRRGTGESIWDVKRNIGYVSPELHLFFDAGASVFDTVASGLFDTIGLFRQLSGAQINSVNQWLQFLQLSPLKSRLLSMLPLGQQRLALLARALIKNPPLLVLDEPTQGLDEIQSAFFNNVIDALCTATDQTLIYVSHYHDELPSCITRHLHLQNGMVSA